MCSSDLSVLVRVPLGWSAGAGEMIRDANPLERAAAPDVALKQTVEFRCPDGSADVYLLLAGLVVAARHGLEMADGAEYARARYVGVNIFDERHREVLERLDSLPASCAESAARLLSQRDAYERYGVFAPRLVDGVAARLEAFGDGDLRSRLGDDTERIMALVDEHFYCG